MHWVDKNGQRPTYYIMHGVFERYPSLSHPKDSAINYFRDGDSPSMAELFQDPLNYTYQWMKKATSLHRKPEAIE
eukprot:14886287-Ditylum_brightwellii.AAC.1